MIDSWALVASSCDRVLLYNYLVSLKCLYIKNDHWTQIEILFFSLFHLKKLENFFLTKRKLVQCIESLMELVFVLSTVAPLVYIYRFIELFCVHVIRMDVM